MLTLFSDRIYIINIYIEQVSSLKHLKYMVKYTNDVFQIIYLEIIIKKTQQDWQSEVVQYTSGDLFQAQLLKMVM